VRFVAPVADGIHVLGVDEVCDGGGANRSNFVLYLEKYYLLEYLIMSLIIIIIIVITN